MRKLMYLAMIILIVLSGSVFAENSAKTFEDVPDDHWAFDAIQYFYHAGIVQGINEETFAPDEFITREQFAKLLAIVFDKTKEAATAQTFSDVTKDMWSFHYIEATKDYLTGYFPNGAAPFFNPSAKATREDIAYALVAITELEKDKTLLENDALAGYKDSNEISIHIRDYVGIAVASGLLRGYDGYLRPQDGITRAETVTLLFRVLKQPVKSPNHDGEPASGENNGTDQIDDSKKANYNTIETASIKKIAGYLGDDVTGSIKFLWSPKENDAEFLADLKCKNGAFEYAACKISLVELISCTEKQVEGYFSVSIDNEIKDGKIKGTIAVKGNELRLNTMPNDYGLIAEIHPAVDVPGDDDNQPGDDNNQPGDDSSNQNINPSDETIYSEKITSFKIINTDGENCEIINPDRLEGRMAVTLGKEGGNATKFEANVTVDGRNAYRVVSTDVERYSYSNNGNVVKVELSYKVYKNGTVIIEDGGYQVVIDKVEDSFFLKGQTGIVAEKIIWPDKKMPPAPEEQPQDQWESGKEIGTRVKAWNDKSAAGNGTIRFDKAHKAVEMNVKAEVDGSSYTIELDAVSSITEAEIIGTFRIVCDGKEIAKSVPGKISGLDSQLGQFILVETDNGECKIDMQIVEIGA